MVTGTTQGSAVGSIGSGDGKSEDSCFDEIILVSSSCGFFGGSS